MITKHKKPLLCLFVFLFLLVTACGSKTSNSNSSNNVPNNKTSNSIASSASVEDNEIERIYDLYLASGGEMTYEEWLNTIKGEPGENGASLLTGYGAPSNNLGKNGDSYIDTKSWDFYAKNNNVWVKQGNIKGEDGQSQQLENQQGLDFYLKDDDTYAVGIGNAILLSNIVIPETYCGKPVSSIITNGFKESNIISIAIPKSIKTIGQDAFSNCVSLIKVNMEGDSLEKIEDRAFYNCVSLESFSIPSSLKIIGNGAFEQCVSLKTFAIPATLTTLGEGLLINCKELKSIIFEEGIESIPARICIGCDKLTRVSIPTTVKEICKASFRVCSSLTNINLPEGISIIGSSSFAASGLEKIELPTTTTIIEEEAFSSCRQLSSLTIKGNNLKEINAKAFKYCVSLSTFSIPESVEYIAETAFDNCDVLQYNDDNDGKYLGNNENPYLWLMKVTTDGNTSFNVNSNCKHIINEAFKGKSLSWAVNLPDGLISIGKSVFAYSTIQGIIIPDSVTLLGEEAFYYCESLEQLIIGEGLKEIQNSTFSQCKKLSAIVIGGSITKIGEYAFYYCTNLNNIQFTGTVEQWNAIEKEYNWNYKIKATSVRCKDGYANL